jgi:hypothetical protein
MVQSRRSKYLACLLVAAATSGALYAKPDLDLAPSFESLDLTTVLRICPPKVQLPTPDDERCTSNTAESIAATQKMQLYTEPFWALVELRNNTKDDRIYVLEHLLAITERVAVEELSDKAAAIKVAGEGASVYARDYRAPLPAYRLQFKAGETKFCGFRFDLIWSRAWVLRCTQRGIISMNCRSRMFCMRAFMA